MSSSHAPGALEDLRLFVNTDDPEDPASDVLGSLERARAWLAESAFRGGARSESDLARLRALRSVLREVLLANAGHGDPASWEGLEAFAASAPLLVRLGREPALVPAGEGESATVGALLAIVYDSVRDGSWARLKICREDSCAWAFYDRSKNGSGAWCSMKVCGNRAKARRRRERTRRTSEPLRIL